jgi:hydroxymethylpyrimidine/phosphomethylpyrimidine kinase
MNQVPKTLTIAGSDSGGGAGIQADLKTFSALGCYGTSVITALTAQNTQGVNNISGVEPSFIQDQLRAVLADIGADAIKIGMLHADNVIQAIATVLSDYPDIPVVLDPVMVAKSGDRLLQEDAIEALKIHLLPKASLITPNLPEAEVLTAQSIGDEAAMREALPALLQTGPEAVLLKGGHLSSSGQSPDLFHSHETAEPLRIDSERIDTPNTHGTGCTLSSAIAAYRAHGYAAEAAVKHAKTYMTEALRAGAQLSIGKGKGPVHHFYAYWAATPQNT